MRIQNFLIVIILILTSFAGSITFVSSVVAESEVTPTTAPTKTVTPDIVASPTATATLQSIEERPAAFTQEQLSVLTGNIQRPNGITWHDNRLYLSCTGDWTIYEIVADTGETNPYIYGIKNAHMLLATNDSDGVSLWIPDFQSNSFVQIVSGVTKIIASDLAGPWGIVQLDNSQFLVSNLKSNNLVVINRDGEVREIVKGLRSPTGVTLDGDYVYVSNTGSARRAIEWFHRDSIASSSTVIDSTDPSFVQPLVSGLQNVTNLVMASDDYLYMAYSLGSRGIVGRVDPVQCRDQGGCKASDVEIVVYTELAAPLAGLTISPDMRLYIHSIFSPDVYWVDLNKTQ
jgi:hypothetical protein